jgi:hypothetical protein
MRHGRQIDKVTRVKKRIITNNIDQKWKTIKTINKNKSLSSPTWTHRPSYPLFGANHFIRSCLWPIGLVIANQKKASSHCGRRLHEQKGKTTMLSSAG